MELSATNIVLSTSLAQCKNVPVTCCTNVFVGFVQIWCLIFWFHVVMMRAMSCWYMLVWLVFFYDWYFIMELLQSSLDVS